MKTVRLYYCMIDHGDGSSSPFFFSTEEAAIKYEERDMENSGGGCCDPSQGYVDIDIDKDGNISGGGIDEIHWTDDPEQQ